MSRVLGLLLLALPAAADLAGDLKRFDPTVLDRAEERDARKEAERRAEARYGPHAREHLPELLREVEAARKKERLAALARKLREELEQAGGPDHSTAAEALCDAFAALDQASAAVDRRRIEIDEKYRTLLTGDPAGAHWQYRKGSVEEAKALEQDRLLLREYAYHLLDLRIRSGQLLDQKRSDGAERWLAREALTKGKEPLLRVKVAEVLSRREGVEAGVFLGAAAKEKDGGVRAALLGFVGNLGDRARDAVARIAAFLEDPDERVRVATARTLARLHVPEAVEPLVIRMAKESGRTVSDFAFALESLTGEKLGAHAESWAGWWAANRATVLAEGLPPPGGGAGDLRAMRWKGEGGFYYGLPQVSKRIVYVLDTSDSMRFDMDGQTRLARCAAEIQRAIDALPRDAAFNVIAYNTEVRRWRDDMAPATPPAKDEAKRFIGELRPAHTTNIYDALREAFALAGEGAKQKGSRVRVDTIYLLSDGAPTLPDASADDPERILAAAREWNALGRVTIHTIGIGQDLKFTFLERLAAEHHGHFVQKE